MQSPFFNRKLRYMLKLNRLQLIFLCLLVLVYLLPNHGSAFLPDRRGAQSSTESSWYILPAPYSLPEVGTGFIVAGLYNNIAGSHSDALLAATTGDIDVTIAGFLDNHLIDDTLVLDVVSGTIHQMVATAYNGRGMETDPKDYNLLVTGEGKANGAQLNLRYTERRFQLNCVTGGGHVS